MGFKSTIIINIMEDINMDKDRGRRAIWVRMNKYQNGIHSYYSFYQL